MRNSEAGDGHGTRAPAMPAGVEPVMGRRSLTVMLGGLSLLGPLSIDAYLPAFADIQRDFQASTADLQFTLTGYLLAFACICLWAQAGHPLCPAGIRLGGARMCAVAQRRLVDLVWSKYWV
jgi:hypothetical protein